MIVWSAVLSMLGALSAGCGPLTFVVGPSAGDRSLRATVVEPARGWLADRVAIIDVSGTIMNADKRQFVGEGDNPLSLLHESLEKARLDPRTKAVILRLNTPGGTVTASDAMYRIVQRFKKRSGKPVVAMMMDVAASGGYYLACAADTIQAYPSTVTGSIGVIMQTINFKTALSRLGIQSESFTTGANKDIGSPLGTMTDDHRAILHSLVDDFYQDFLAVVRQARPGIPPDRFSQVTDGRVFTGREAIKLGLVDHLGDLHDAFDLAKELASLKDAQLVVYHRPLHYVGSPYAATPTRPDTWARNSTQTQINLAQINFSGSLARPPVEFYYLWQP